MTPTPSVWRSFMSWGTLFSGLAAFIYFGLYWTWTIGILVILLLYIHEIGHVLAARIRRIPVQRSPYFLPGLGAYVMVGARASIWDDVILYLGGPVLGMFAALSVILVGLMAGSRETAYAGHWMAVANLFNLAPFTPLDGGQLVSRTGWMGLVPTVLMGGAAMYFFKFDSIITIITGYGIMQAYKASKAGTNVPLGTAAAALGVYVWVFAAMGVAWAVLLNVGGNPFDMTFTRPDWLPEMSTMFLVILGASSLSQWLGQSAWRQLPTAAGRYIVAGILFLPFYLVHKPAAILIHACLGAHLVGLPGLRWLRSLIGRWAKNLNTYAAGAAANGYDCLMLQGRQPDAAAWLRETGALLYTPHAGMLYNACLVLKQGGYRTAALDLLLDAVEDERMPADQRPVTINNLAWELFLAERSTEALPYARQAVAGASERLEFLDTLGQILLALHEPTEAELHLRTALRHKERTGTRVALARALALQERHVEAVSEAELALRNHYGCWPADEPGEAQVKAWVQEWRKASLQIPA